MLKIRSEQFLLFSEAARESFEERLLLKLRKSLSEQTTDMAEADIRETISQEIEKARDYGITTERDVARFVILAFLWGANFDENPKHPWIPETLTNYDEPIEVRLDRLCAQARKDFPDNECLNGV